MNKGSLKQNVLTVAAEETLCYVNRPCDKNEHSPLKFVCMERSHDLPSARGSEQDSWKQEWKRAAWTEVV